MNELKNLKLEVLYYIEVLEETMEVLEETLQNPLVEKDLQQSKKLLTQQANNFIKRINEEKK